MRTAFLVLSLLLLLGGTPASAENWIALWQFNEIFLGLNEQGELYRYVPASGETQPAGSFGPGPWVSFGRHDDLLLALKSDGEIWSLPSEGGAATLFWTLPAGHEWCAIQQHPDIRPWCVISCDGEVWSLWEPLHMLADFGLYAPGRWICIANADDSYFATLENGDTWQGFGEYFHPAGTYGPGPWVGFSRTYGIHGDYLSLGANGEIWAHGWSFNPELYLALPADRQWCAIMTGPIFDTGPGYALSCNGEIWSVESPPSLIGTFALPTPVEPCTWGRIKAAHRLLPPHRGLSPSPPPRHSTH